MKYILSFLGIGIIVLAICLCGSKSSADEDYLRIHIVANSNSTYDQNIKYVVKDAIVEFLIPYLAEAETVEEAEQVIEDNLTKIEEVVKAVLKSEGVSYEATVCLSSEKMPTRAYENLVLEEGIYQCLIVKLGQAKGDNWWCVVFPAVCFVDSKNFANVEYISKILDIIDSVI